MSGNRIRVSEGRSEDPQAGNITVLSLGVSVLAIMLILVISAASAVHLQHMRLSHLADELALEAADALDVDAYYDGSAATPTEDAAVSLATARMRTAVDGHVASAQQRLNLEGVSVVAVETHDGTTATVTVAVVVTPLFGMEALMPFADGIELVATGTARSY